MCPQYLHLTETLKKQRCMDGVMNEFLLFWCRHPLVPLLFHDVTSLHPLHFREIIFPLVPCIFQFGAKPQ